MNVIAIVLRGKGFHQTTRPYLMRTENFQTFFWGLHGPTHCSSNDHRILKNYGRLPESPPRDASIAEFDAYDAALDEIELQFIMDFPPPATDANALQSRDTEGWVAPDGTIYVCEYGAHRGLAYSLWAILTGTLPKYSQDAFEDLRARNWIPVYPDFILEPAVGVTPEQRHSLKAWAAVSQNDRFKRRIEGIRK